MKILQCKLTFFAITFVLLAIQPLQAMQQAKAEEATKHYFALDFEAMGKKRAHTIKEIATIQFALSCAVAAYDEKPGARVDIADDNPLFADKEALEKNKFYQRGVEMAGMLIDTIEAFLKDLKSECVSKAQLQRNEQVRDICLFQDERSASNALFYWKGYEKVFSQRSVDELIARSTPTAESAHIVAEYFRYSMGIALNVTGAFTFYQMRCHWSSDARYKFTREAEFQAIFKKLN